MFELDVPARKIPVPRSISPEAQAAISRPLVDAPPYPPLDDTATWKAMIAATDAVVASMIAHSQTDHVSIVDAPIGGVRTFEVTPLHGEVPTNGVFLEIHGGALINGAGDCCRALAVHAAARFGCRVFAPDYRMAPDHPYPGSLDDCVATYRGLLERYAPEQIIVGGGSAGANLAAALVLRARDEGLPMPAAVVLVSPELDLTESGDTFQTLAPVDLYAGHSLMQVNLLYANGHPLDHPYLSPLFADFTKGYPPTLLTAGTRDVFLSNAARMHRALRAAGVPAELHVLEAAPHGGFMTDTPEERELNADIRRFLAEHWPSD